jgi:hypothetical protein
MRTLRSLRLTEFFGVTTIIDAISLAQGTMPIVKRSRSGRPVGITPEMELSLLQRNHDVEARLIANDTSNMTVASCIVSKHHVARPETFHGAVAGLDLHLS